MRFTLLSSAAFCGLFLSVAAVPIRNAIPRGEGYLGEAAPGVAAPAAPAPAPAPHAPVPIAGAGAPGTVNEIPTGVGADGHPCGGRGGDGLVSELTDGVNTILCEGLDEDLSHGLPTTLEAVGDIL
ncbi:uncharacterized protein KD926_008406 [Aspergillus affinis]|uniref:uncharacterized protein n=1 Tax=Aspergillus affinis TaxID=1070780 RepID=UPI0022FDBFF7|nr:uncharacterized protein KD926_008406 [Aspergillus affinis]KAI9040316.1 hypothetical protein KD926_008406 [Aspergillus affinis]